MKPVKAEQIGKFIGTRFLNGRTVAVDEDLLLTGQIDSLGVAALIAFLEDLRGASIPPQDVTLENFATIASMTNYLNNG